MASRAQKAVEKRDPDKIPPKSRRLAAVPDPNPEKPKSERARLREVKEFAETLPDNWLQCREMNHTWRPRHVRKLPGGAFQRTLRCSRCYTRKIQELTSRGAVVRVRYEHPEGYLRKGLGQINGTGRDALRLASIMRLDIQEVED